MTAANPDPIIRSVLRHEIGPWNDHGDPTLAARFIEAARFHGVLPLLDAGFRDLTDSADWPKEVLLSGFKATLVCTAFEDAHRPEITRVLDALAADGVRPLLFKGGALAYSHYPEPALRTRNDTDLFIPDDQREQAGRTLEGLGYAKSQDMGGEFIPYQSLWSRPAPSGLHHRLDVHWRINNSQVLAKVLSYAELAARSTALPALGASARALAPVDALLLACIHRAGHGSDIERVGNVARRSSDRLIWLYDIHLLVAGMTGTELDAFASLAAERRVRAVCLDALRRSEESLGTVLPSRLLQALSRGGPVEPSAHLIRAGWGRRLAGEFLAIDGWPARGRWLGELALPSTEHMRRKYPGLAAPWLPLLYLHRALAAILRQVFARRDGN